MVNQLDTSALDPGAIKSIRDFQIQNALENQKVQAGNIANASAQHAHAVQVLSEAVASGNQGIYDNAKAGLTNMGIDVSNLAPDIQTGATQVQAARNALYNSNPLLAALGIQQKAEANNIAATQAAGNQAGGVALDPVSQQILNSAKNNPIKIPGTVNQPAPGMPSPGPTNGIPASNTSNAGMNMDVSSETVSPEAQYAAMSGVQPTVTTGTVPTSEQPTGLQPVNPPAALPQQLPTSNLAPAQPPVNAASAPFVPPEQQSGETAAAYNARADRALKIWQESTGKKAADASATSAATKQGDEIGDVNKALNTSMSNIPATVQRMTDVIKNADNASYGGGVNNEGNGYAQQFASTGLGQTFEPGRAGSNALMEKSLAQGVLPEIGNALSQSNLKGNKFLESLFNNALSIPLEVPNDVKKQLAQKNIDMYVQTTKAMAQHARDLGQQAPTDEQIDAAVLDAIQKAKTNSTPQIPGSSPSSAEDPIAAELRKRGVQ